MIRRLLSAGLFSLGLTGPVAAAAQERSLSPDQAPAAWVAYADETNRQIATWLGTQDEVAVRLRTYLDTTRPAPDQPTPDIPLRIWINAAGTIERVELTSLPDAQASADLRALLVGRSIGTPPPAGMLLPLRMAIALAPAPPHDPESVTAPAP